MRQTAPAFNGCVAGKIGRTLEEILPSVDCLQVELGGAALGEFEEPSTEALGLAFAVVILVVEDTREERREGHEAEPDQVKLTLVELRQLESRPEAATAATSLPTAGHPGRFRRDGASPSLTPLSGRIQAARDRVMDPYHWAHGWSSPGARG